MGAVMDNIEAGAMNAYEGECIGGPANGRTLKSRKRRIVVPSLNPAHDPIRHGWTPGTGLAYDGEGHRFADPHVYEWNGNNFDYVGMHQISGER